jgi:FkbM family methyltransferase
MIIEFDNKKIDIDESIITERDKKSQFPLQTFEIWRSFIKPGDVVFDIGAYIGLIAICFEKLGAKVHAFEGSPRNIGRLKQMKQYTDSTIEIHEIALSDRDERLVTRFNDCVDREHPEQEVQFRRYLGYQKEKQLPNPSFIKMDIEGMETVALKCMKNLIEDARPVWQIEWHKGIQFKYKYYPGFVEKEEGGFDFAEFERFGYRIFDQNKKRIKISNMKCFENYFFIPSRLL